jgi:hypothetical protein
MGDFAVNNNQGARINDPQTTKEPIGGAAKPETAKVTGQKTPEPANRISAIFDKFIHGSADAKRPPSAQNTTTAKALHDPGNVQLPGPFNIITAQRALETALNSKDPVAKNAATQFFAALGSFGSNA